MNFVFKEVKTTSMKAAGILDADNMIIEVDGDQRTSRHFYLYSTALQLN